MTTFTGTPNNDVMPGTSGADFFNMNDGGDDTVNAAGGDDVTTFGSTFTSADKVNGGSGYDAVLLNGNYAAGVTLSSTTLSSVEEIDMLGSGNSYKLIMNNANVGSGLTLVVSAANLDSGHTLYFDSTADGDSFFKITSGAGNDTIKVRGSANTITTGAGIDNVTLTGSAGGAHDTISTGTGADTINAGAVVLTNEAINGGADSDTVILNGDYSSGATFNANTITNVEQLSLTAGHSYLLRENTGNLIGAQSLLVDAQTLGASQFLTWDGSAETDGGTFHVLGGAGNDTIIGGAGNDQLEGKNGNDSITTGAGVDTVDAGAGDDQIFMNATMTAADTIGGGLGADHLFLAGNYSAGVTFNATTMTGVENLTVSGNNSYNVTLNNGNVASGASLTIDDSVGLTAGNTFKFDVSAETDGHLRFIVGGAETVDIKQSGNSFIDLLASFTAADKVSGGRLFLHGGTAGALVFGATTMQDVQLTLMGHVSYNMKLHDGNVSAGKAMQVADDIANMTAADTVTFDASAELDGSFDLKIGGAEKKILTGGALGDRFELGANLHATDSVSGGGGDDTVELNGDYSGGLTLGAGTIKDIATLAFDSGHNYTITTNDGNVAAGKIMNIADGSSLAGDVVKFDGSAETDGSFHFAGGLSSEILTGGALGDSFATGLGNDTLNGGDGNDQFFFATGEFTVADAINGGNGTDTVFLNGDYSATLVMGAATLTNVETLVLLGSNHNIVMSNANVAAGATLSVVDDNGKSLTFDGSAESDGAFSVNATDGNDVVTTGSGADTIQNSLGTDVIHAGAGDDIIFFVPTGSFDATDVADGGDGNDTLQLEGDHTVALAATSLNSIEKILLDAGHAYNLTTVDANVANGALLIVDGSALSGAASILTFDGSAETDGTFILKGGANGDTLTGGAGNDTIIGGAGVNTLNGGGGDDTINITQNGGDTVDAGGGNDSINAGAAFNLSDSVDGGSGNDALSLNGDYSAALTFVASTIVNVETINLAKGNNYKITTDDGNVGAGQTLTISGVNLLAGDSIVFNGAAESDGTFSIIGGAGNDTMTGGAGKDTFNLTKGGNDVANGGGGSDTFNFAAAFSAGESVDGGAGGDTVKLAGDYSAGVVFSAATMVNVETLTLSAGNSYALTTDDATVANGAKLTVDGSSLAAGQTLNFNGAAEADHGQFVVNGGAGNDILVGGNGTDTFIGGLGADSLKGNVGADTFIYSGVNESTGSAYDTLVLVNLNADRIDLDVTVTGTDTAVTTGTLSSASFNSDLVGDLGVTKLLAGHAVLFTADAGTLSGHTFLVVDHNGAAGYQQDQDYVFEVTGGTLGGLSSATFI